MPRQRHRSADSRGAHGGGAGGAEASGRRTGSHGAPTGGHPRPPRGAPGEEQPPPAGPPTTAQSPPGGSPTAGSAATRRAPQGAGRGAAGERNAPAGESKKRSPRAPKGARGRSHQSGWTSHEARASARGKASRRRGIPRPGVRQDQLPKATGRRHRAPNRGGGSQIRTAALYLILGHYYVRTQRVRWRNVHMKSIRSDFPALAGSMITALPFRSARAVFNIMQSCTDTRTAALRSLQPIKQYFGIRDTKSMILNPKKGVQKEKRAPRAKARIGNDPHGARGQNSGGWHR